MPRILHIDSSARRDGSISRQLSRELVDALVAADPSSSVTYRDVSQEPITHVEANWVTGAYTPSDVRSPEQLEALRLSDQLVDELVAADVFVFGVPVYNFSVPAAFKAYIDQIARYGRTFQSTPQGPQGLLTGKKAYVVGASGSGSHNLTTWGLNYHEPYLKSFFGFIGVTDLTFVTAGGNDPDTIKRTTDEARTQIEQIAGERASAGAA
jgi:FMN-dependent NADH-azoreductase